MGGVHALDETRDRFDRVGRACRVEDVEGVLRARQLRVDDGVARDAAERRHEVPGILDVGEGIVGAVDNEERRRIGVDT